MTFFPIILETERRKGESKDIGDVDADQLKPIQIDMPMNPFSGSITIIPSANTSYVYLPANVAP